jgi:hypothetical protein
MKYCFISENILFDYLQVCLEELNYDIERVINAVLEDRLPQSLQEVDRQIPRY